MQEQLSLKLPYRPSYGRGDFLVAPCNFEAVQWIDHCDSWCTPAIIIYGESGCGKSHLATTFSPVCLDARIMDLSQLPTVCPKHTVIEHIDETVHEETLFHLYNRITGQGSKLLMTARQIPQFRLKDLQSRINATPKIAISTPDEELIYAVFYKAFQDRQLMIEPKVIEYAVLRIPRSFEAVKKVFEQADSLSLSRGQKVTIPLMKSAIEQALSSC